MTTDSKSLRIVFAGTPDFAKHFLQLLIDTGHQVVAAYTQPDRPAGRGKKLQASPVKQLAQSHGIPVLQPKNFREQTDRDELQGLNADLMIVVAYGLILPESVLGTPRQGCINVHASVLPRWRGAAPIHRAIETGDKETGVTIMQMDAGLDTGDMLNIKTCEITGSDTTATLHDKLVEVGKPALLETLSQIAQGLMNPAVQASEQAVYAHKIEKIEGHIDWNLDAETLDRKIRAFVPFPVAYTDLNTTRIKIHKASILEKYSSGTPGTIINTNESGIDVQTGAGTIRVQSLQLPGKRALPVADILRGYPDLFASNAIFTSPLSSPTSA